MRRLRNGDASGFTVIEFAFAMALFGIISAIAVVGWRQYQRAHDQESSAASLVATMRSVQQRAASEGQTYCVQLDATDHRGWSVWRGACGTGTRVEGRTSTFSGDVTYANASFADRSGGTSDTDVYFYRSGMASSGSVQIVRGSGSKVYTISVEGLTARVSLR